MLFPSLPASNAQNDSVLWVSDTHSSKRTLVKMLVHKGEIRE